MPAARVLLLPGFGNSGPGHWQTLWEARHGYERVLQDDWDAPGREAWIAGLDRAVRRTEGPVVIAAHSLGGAVVAHWAALAPTSNVVGYLCVCPADVDSEMHTPDEVRGFAPMPLAPLPFPTIVVASRTDPYVRFARAQEMSQRWGARLVDAGRAGHLNLDSGHGDWPEGHALLEELLARAV